MKFLTVALLFGAVGLLLVMSTTWTQADARPRAKPEIDVKAPTKVETATFALG